MKLRRPGRPLSGLRKRVRTSFTLSPEYLLRLKQYAESRGLSSSEALDELLDTAFASGLFEGPKSNVRIRVPRLALEEICKKHGVKRLKIFGSALTDRFGPKSDVDFLVEFLPGRSPGLFEIAEMEMELSGLLGGKKADLRTPNELGRHFRARVLEEAEEIYAA